MFQTPIAQNALKLKLLLNLPDLAESACRCFNMPRPLIMFNIQVASTAGGSVFLTREVTLIIIVCPREGGSHNRVQQQKNGAFLPPPLPRTQRT
eukprot:15446394-Alexandrium_andersonii.AAC.1